MNDGDSQDAEWPSTHNNVRQTTIEILPEAHRNVFSEALDNVLATDIAEITYAQLLDGVPLADVANDRYSPHFIDDRHPIQRHTELCPGVLERTRAFRASFDPSIINFDLRLVNDYMRSGVGSAIFKIRLMEMIAVAVHQIAVLVYKLDGSLHKEEQMESWTPPPVVVNGESYYSAKAYRTLFFAMYYTEHDSYPDGVADTIGYWAENRILGGVALFYRGPSNPELDNKIFFHSDRKGVTRRIYALSDEQKAALLAFLLSDSPAENPLPMLGDRSNRLRADPEDATERQYIFRDRWERAPLNPRWVDRTPRKSLDYPEVQEQREILSRVFGDP